MNPVYVPFLIFFSTFAPFESNLKNMKSASGKGPPDEAHGPGEDPIRPQRSGEAWGSREKRVRTGTLLYQRK